MQTLSELCDRSYFPLNPRIRSAETRRQYAFALADFAAALGRPARTGDLTDGNVSRLLSHLRTRGLAAKTCNERAGRILAIWRWLYHQRQIDVWPLPQSLAVPRRVPLAWTRAELDALLTACRGQRGAIAGVRAALWWSSLHLVLWDSGERISALLACRWDYLSGEHLSIPAECRKGQTEDRVYRLSQPSLDLLGIIRFPQRPQIWPWPYHPLYLWQRYRALRRAAGLPTDRRSSFHRMRRSVASHFEAAGGNATELLGHSDRKLTRSSYIDPRICETPQAADRLFPMAAEPNVLPVPWEG